MIELPGNLNGPNLLLGRVGDCREQDIAKLANIAWEVVPLQQSNGAGSELKVLRRGSIDLIEDCVGKQRNILHPLPQARQADRQAGDELVLGPSDGYVKNTPKDMVTALPGQVTRIKATFDKSGRYVWHCHILSPEDHEMMRVLEVVPGV